MPVIYRRRRPPPTSPSPPQPEITDADDSIVLSDLVRSGEASRLRRRGAIRENPSSSAATSASSHDAAPPPPPRVLTFRSPSPPPLVSPAPAPAPVPDLAVAYPYAYAYPPDDDDSGSASESGAEWDWSRRERGEAVLGRDIFVEGSRAGVWGEPAAPPRDGPEVELRLDVDDEREGVYMLFCGGESEGEEDARLADGEEEEGVRVPRRRRSAFVPGSGGARRPKAGRSNGCGALLHIAAHPRRKHGCWIARGAGGAADAVVGMDASYFEERAVAKMMRSACGCIREGVGCRACGNPLGTIYLPCQAAADGLFASPSTPPTPPPQSPPPAQPSSSTSTADPTPPPPPSSHLLPLRPSGPVYYLPQPSPSTSTSSTTPPRHRQAIFTFLGSHVRSAPTYSFPPTASRQGTGESRWFEQEEDGREWGGSMRRRYMLSAARGRGSGSSAVLMRSETMPTSSGSFSSLREREDDGEAEKPEGQTGGMVRPER